MILTINPLEISLETTFITDIFPRGIQHLVVVNLVIKLGD